MESPIAVDNERVERAAADLITRLDSLGLTAGDPVAIYAGNSLEFLAARTAATARDLIAVPINPKLAAPEIEFVLASSGARAILVEPGFSGRVNHPVTLLVDITAGGEADSRLLDTIGRAAGLIGATLIYTSGTTGRPKGCMRPIAAEAARAAELAASYSITRDDIQLIACPLAHSAPGIFARAGRKVGARTALMPRFRPESFLAAVEEIEATLFFLVPTQIERLLALPPAVRGQFDLSSVRSVIVAGAPFPVATKRAAIEWLGEDVLWEFYGSSETGTVSVMPPALHDTHPGSVGKPPPGVEVRILGDDRQPVPSGEVGEIHVRSPAVMSGYVHHPDPFVNGFLSVGDLGHVSDDGFLYLVDRKFDTIISGGVNVYPAEVERALAEHPEVEGAVAFGIDDDDWGQIVAAVVVGEPTGDELRSFLRKRIAPFKIPKAFATIDRQELPIGSSGKPLRRQARTNLAHKLTRYD